MSASSTTRSPGLLDRSKLTCSTNNYALFGSIELRGAPIPYSRGSEIFGQDEPAEYVYKVLDGFVRTYIVLNDGRRQITAFHVPGDTFGIEMGDFHIASAEAISDATILVVRRSAVVSAALRDQSLLTQLLAATRQELRHAQDHVLLLVKTAQERVAAFLLEMADRLPGDSVELPMSRQDIADYLGLTIETVSRTLTQLGHARAIELPSARRIVLRNRNALARLNS